jgi:hypothetical protein
MMEVKLEHQKTHALLGGRREEVWEVGGGGE